MGQAATVLGKRHKEESMDPYANTIWVSSGWLWLDFLVWVGISVSIGSWIDNRVNGAAGYGPADSVVAGLPAMFLGLIIGTPIFIGLEWAFHYFVNIGYRS